MLNLLDNSHKMRRLLHTFVLLSGLALVPLMPLDMLISIDSEPSHTTFYVHLALHGVSLLLALAILAQSFLKAGSIGRVLGIITLLFLIAVTLQSLAPITERDALIHHMAVPKWWVASNRVTEISWHDWSYYPMMIQVAFAHFLSWGKESFASLYHGSYLILLAALCVSFLKARDEDDLTASSAAFLVISTPILFRLASAPMVDIPLGVYSLIAIDSLLLRLQAPGLFKQPLKIGIALGLAVSCKLNGLLVLAIILGTLFFGSVVRKHKVSQLLGASFIIVTITFLVYSPWMAKNLWTIGNPLYPLFKSILGGAKTSVGVGSLPPLQHRVLVYGEGWVELITMPIRMALLGQDHSGKYFDGILGPIFLIAPLALFSLKNKPWLWQLAFFSVVYFCFAVVLASARTRYLIPLAGPLFVFTAVSISYFTSFFSKTKVKALILPALLTVHLIGAAYYVGNTFTKKNTFGYLSGNLSQTDYLSQNLSEYQLINYINTELPEDSNIYLLYTGNLFYYYDRSVVSGGHFSASRLLRLLKKCDSAENFARELDAAGITHLVMHADRTKAAFQEILDDRKKRLWNIFIDTQTTPIHAEVGYGVWKLGAPINEAVENESDS